MKMTILRSLKYLLPASVFVIILAVGTLSFQQSTATAGPQQPHVTEFSGELTFNVLAGIKRVSTKNVIAADPEDKWVSIFEADFENDNWEDQWLNISQGGDGYKYGTRKILNTEDPDSKKVAWAVGQSPSGESALNPAVDGYPAEVSSWLIAGPFDFADVGRINLAWEYSFEADSGDTFAVHASTDLINFSGPEINGGEGGWLPQNLDLSDYAGKPLVWIAFIFKSDDSPNIDEKLGLLIDNVQLDVRGAANTYMPLVLYDLVPTPEVTPTPTITPGDVYYKGFTNNIDPWDEVRWSAGADYDLGHSDSCEGETCGFLNLLVEASDDYAIVSPKIASKPYPYTLETHAKIRSPRVDMDSYGIVFGASTNGQTCPANNFSTCFNHYYELRARYRDVDGDQWIEFKLVKVEGHDENNQPIGTDLIDWTKINDDPEGFVEWDVKVKENADIVVKASDDKYATVNDSSFLNNPFFGLIVTSGPNDSSEVKFDSFEVK